MNLDELQRVAEAATQDDWAWFGNGAGNLHLGTQHHGRLIVMDFVRQGMTGAQPRFALTVDGQNRGVKGGIMHTAAEIIKKRGRLDHPDAAHIESFDPPTVLKLLAIARAADAWHETDQNDAEAVFLSELNLHAALCAGLGKSLDGVTPP